MEVISKPFFPLSGNLAEKTAVCLKAGPSCPAGPARLGSSSASGVSIYDYLNRKKLGKRRVVFF
jgi:hypothetical protein